MPIFNEVNYQQDPGVMCEQRSPALTTWLEWEKKLLPEDVGMMRRGPAILFHMALSPISFQGRIAGLLETLLQIGILDIHLALLLIVRFFDPLFLVTCLFGVKNLTA